MKTEQIKQLTHNELKKLAQSIEQEKGPDFQKLLDTMANFPQYSERNALLIALQCPNATQVAGFYTWKNQGRSVKKGEKKFPTEDQKPVELALRPTENQTV